MTHTCVHRFTVLWDHLLIFSSTLFFYYNVIKSVRGSWRTIARTPVFIAWVVHNGERRRILPVSVLSWIHLHISSKCQVWWNRCGYMLRSGLCALKSDDWFVKVLSIFFEFTMSRLNYRLVHKHSCVFYCRAVLTIIRFLVVHLCNHWLVTLWCLPKLILQRHARFRSKHVLHTISRYTHHHFVLLCLHFNRKLNLIFFFHKYSLLMFQISLFELWVNHKVLSKISI